MKFIDVATIKLQAGKGGDGAVAFRRELYVPKGGPAGGDGGNGGDIIFVGDEGMNTLLDLKYQREIKAQDGEKGDIKDMHGKNAPHKYVKVPLGTLVINNTTNQIICDILEHNQECIVAKGGKGGRGNARFANSRNKAPTIFEAGDLGESLEVRCELKVLADVGLVGLPNAGKSTLLSKISKAKPQIADYPFTTLTPQLGVAKDSKKRSFVVADLPGLIEGASLGKGLGHDFLRHIERCKIIVHVIDMSGNYGTENVVDNYHKIQNELKSYNYKLELRKELIVANKMDIDNARENLQEFKKQIKNADIIETSGLLNQNLDVLLNRIGDFLAEIKENKALWQLGEIEPTNDASYKHYTYEEKQPDVQVINLGNGLWKVEGESVFKAYHKTPISTYDNLLLFNKKLQDLKVFEMLRVKGAQPGDTVKIFDYELEWDG
ncbi:GTPase ObgE [Spiroplasma eriocheiris]|uniref:GTPase Obg n=1 Tax=Spiroplasma eriocheiris TaxID=315358 RepID=A0A0H3XKT6_9MOLU|nr:GTPase ObgE [Spiroplasma eriocheiris]AHF57615.1 putative GTPase [Spiroplasma eriocheiris CCTCC M 207170]AKM54069.1 GTPase ObgE [Spiroplasma eriocheiris]